MNYTEYKHELIIPNESIPVKIFDFAAHNDLRVIPYHWHNSAEILYVRRGKLNIWMNKRIMYLNKMILSILIPKKFILLKVLKIMKLLYYKYLGIS